MQHQVKPVLESIIATASLRESNSDNPSALNELLRDIAGTARAALGDNLTNRERVMLDALVAIESCLRPEDNDYAAKKVRAAIAMARGQV